MQCEKKFRRILEVTQTRRAEKIKEGLRRSEKSVTNRDVTNRDRIVFQK